MWWYKLIKYWSISDIISYIVSIWLITFTFNSTLAIIQGEFYLTFNEFILPFLALPFPIIFFLIVQKYSSKVDEISNYHNLDESDFKNIELQKKGPILAFFYADWCPFCRKAFPLLNYLKSDNYRVFRVNISKSNNPLWKLMKIKVVPTIITFKDGSEFWRKDGQLLIGLRRQDFEEAEKKLKLVT